MKKIIVTGSNGFIGKHLSKNLKKSGYEVLSFDVNNGDICQEEWFTYFNTTKADHVFHLAGRTFVPDSWINPVLFYKINTMGTLNVLEFCRKESIPVTILSSYLYGEPQYLPIDENHPLSAFNPYGHSKLLAENLCKYYKDTFNVQITIFRVFNVFGPGQSSKFLIPKIIDEVSDNDKKIVQVMDLRPKRDYIFIDDLISALMLSLNNKNGVYNIGTGSSTSVEELIKITMDILNIKKPYMEFGNPRTNEILEMYADINLIKTELNWEPSISIREGIKKCIE